NSQTGRAASAAAVRSASLRAGFHPLAQVDRCPAPPRRTRDRAHLLRGSTVTVQPRSASTSATAWAISLVAPYLLTAQTSTFIGLAVRVRGRCRSAGGASGTAGGWDGPIWRSRLGGSLIRSARH